jgi:LEA14-like dessication related protein
MKINKKWVIAGAIGLVTVAGALAYLQFKKIMDYTLKFVKLKVNKISANLIDLNVYLLLENKSSVEYTIKSQEYSVYINDNLVTKIENQSSSVIKPKSFNEIGLNVKFNPTDVLKKIGAQGVIGSLLSPEKTIIRIDMKLKISFYGITLKIPFSYVTNMKEINSKKTE